MTNVKETEWLKKGSLEVREGVEKMGYIDTVVEQERRRTKQLQECALKEAERISKILVEWGARRVILFGSLARGGVFTSASDIDIVAEGLGDQYFRVYGKCLRESSFNLDIRAWEDLPEDWKENILRKGVTLYERGGS